MKNLFKKNTSLWRIRGTKTTTKGREFGEEGQKRMVMNSKEKYRNRVRRWETKYWNGRERNE
jgi:hypothetical protein